VSPVFSYTQEAEKTVAELFIESDRRRLIFNEIDIDVYKAVLNFLQKRDKGAAIDE
jgi:propanediol utilization protein